MKVHLTTERIWEIEEEIGLRRFRRNQKPQILIGELQWDWVQNPNPRVSHMKSSLTRRLWSQREQTPPAPFYPSLPWPVAWKPDRQCPFKTKTKGGVDCHTTGSWLVPLCRSSSQQRRQGDSTNKEVCQGEGWSLRRWQRRSDRWRVTGAEPAWIGGRSLPKPNKF